MTPLQLVQYYANLLILQYLQKPKAYATAGLMANYAILPQVTTQSIVASGTPVSGTFILNWTPPGIGQVKVSTTALAYSVTATQMQTALQLLTGLSTVTVSGSMSAGFVITFTGVTPVASLLVVSANSLATSGAVAVSLTVTETDVVLPLAVGNGFNINQVFGPTAVGNQLNIIGKYVGVTRTSSLSTGVITLNDSDFLTLIQFAALKNSAQSSLSAIQILIATFFAHEILVFDYQNMQMSYLISSAIGSQSLVLALVAENLLFRPMGVTLAAVIYAPVINTFFGFRTYTFNTPNNTPFNSYTSYNMNRPWLSYANALIA